MYLRVLILKGETMCSPCARKNDRLFIDEHNAQCDRQELDALDKELDAMGDW